MTRWCENDDLFAEELEKGHFWERQVGRFLSSRDLQVEGGEQSFRGSIEEAPEYASIIDLTVEDIPIEVKSRELKFHTPGDFPYDTAIVDTVSGWEAKEVTPKYVICVSQLTNAMMFLDVDDTRPSWVEEGKEDEKRGILDLFYLCPTELWQPVEVLVSRLRERAHLRRNPPREGQVTALQLLKVLEART